MKTSFLLYAYSLTNLFAKLSITFVKVFYGTEAISQHYSDNFLFTEQGYG